MRVGQHGQEKGTVSASGTVSQAQRGVTGGVSGASKKSSSLNSRRVRDVFHGKMRRFQVSELFVP